MAPLNFSYFIEGTAWNLFPSSNIAKLLIDAQGVGEPETYKQFLIWL